MRNPVQFLLRFRYLFFFLALQAVAFAMLLHTQGHQQSVWMAATGDVVGSIQERRDNVRSYLHLRETNEDLHGQIVEMQASLPSSFIQLTDTLTVVEDSIMRQKYRYTSARVVNLRTNTRNNLMTLDRGLVHDINTRMGVVSGQKVVGVIKDVSDHYAIVLPVINTDFGLQVRHKRSGAVGNLKWTGDDPRTAVVRDIGRHVHPEPGDTLVTNAYSNYFPENMIVATVKQVDPRSDANFLDLTVELATDFNRLEYVEVVENMLSTERRALEAKYQTPEP